MNKAIFLDRDGTINVEKNYLYKIEDFEFLPGVVEALKRLQNAGFLLIVITNQSGIGRGYYSEKDFTLLNDWMVSTLKGLSITINAVYYCPHLPDAKILKYRKDCECRKPKLGMYYQAINDLELDLSKCYAIGDKIRDCAICEGTGCKGILIGTNEKQEIIEAVKSGDYNNVFYSLSLLDSLSIILDNDKE